MAFKKTNIFQNGLKNYPTICCLQETNFKCKNIERSKIKDGKILPWKY